MTVYVIISEGQDSGGDCYSSVVGVASTLEKAQERIKELPPGSSRHHYDVQPYDVDDWLDGGS